MTATSCTSHCDMLPLLKSLGGDMDKAKNLVKIFLQMYPENLEKFDAALSNADHVQLCQIVHDLRSGFAIFSAKIGLALANQLQIKLQGGEEEPELVDDCNRFRFELEGMASELAVFIAV